ncbi:MAG: hemin uptake protein HemP [Alphaproteobacteria bacterium]|nr:hemin uptake protein HemP [Alphaproteobacteria bacterium]
MIEGQSSTPATASKAEEPLRMVDSQELLAGQRELLIKHGGDIYRLRLTSNNKLILMK